MAKPIRITGCTVENAFTFKKLRVDLAHKGLVLVRGRNLDAVQDDGTHSSNGAAKSALFEVIRHVMFGSTARGIKDKEIVRAGSTGGYFAAVSLEKAGEAYQVHQALKHKTHGSGVLVYRGDEIITHQKAKVRNQHFVAENLLGMTEEQFDASVFISQEAAHPLVNGTGAQCTAYLSATFGLGVYDEYRDKLKELTKNADKQAGELAAYEHMVRNAEARLKQIGDPDAVVAEAERLRREVKTLEGLAQTNQTAGDTARRALEQVRTRAELLAELGQFASLGSSEASKRAEKLREQIRTIDKMLVEVAAAARQIENKTALQKNLADAQQSVKTAKATLTMIDAASIKDNIKTLEKQRAAAEAVAAILDAREQVQGTTCSQCGQLVDKKHLAAEIARATAASEQARELQAAIDTARATIDTHQTRIGRYDALVMRVANLKQSIDQLGILNLPQVDAAEQLQRKKTAQLALKELDAVLPVMRQLERIPESTETAEKLEGKLAKCKQVAANIELSRQQTNETWQELSLVVRELDRLKSELAEGRKQLDRLAALRRENELRKMLCKAMQKLKIRRLHGIVKAIQEAVPPCIATMFGEDDVQIEIDDNDPDSIERWASRPGPDGTRVRIPVMGLSKGERARLRVAFIWAVQKLMQPERTVNILVLDEADGGLDRQGLEAYSLLLDQLRGVYESVFVISHRATLSTVRFDHEWVVEKQNGISTLIEDAGSTH